MSDEFLYRAIPAVRAEFADALYQRLSRSEENRLRALGWIGFNRKTFRYSLALVALTAIAVACAREVFKQRYVQVGEMWLLEVAPVTTARYVFWDQPESLSRPPEPIPVAEALEMLPYGLHLPEWVPEGYSLVEEEISPPTHPSWMVNLNWSNERGDSFFLWGCKCDMSIEAPRRMWEEIRINDLPAVLIRGGFSRLAIPTPSAWQRTDREILAGEVRWEEDAGLSLIWDQQGGRLQLWGFGDYLTEEELIRIAESMATP